jgi:predicted Rossmann fold nucleotide-binding protein DprA/Smf involved in DNA uptake
METDDILHALGLVAVSARPAVQYALPLDDAPAAPASSAPPAVASQSASVALAPNADALLRSLTETQRVLFSCLSHTPRHLDALAQAANLTVIQAGVEMTLMELTGLIRRLPGNTYIRAL